MNGPLSGVRVLDLTWGMPGAFATSMLADYGAEVVKVVRPREAVDGPDRTCRTWDRGKASIALHLRDPEDQRVLRFLASGTDVLIEGLRPGLFEELGFGYEALRRLNPAIVFASLSTFGPDTENSEVPGYEALAAARFGVMAESPGHRDGPIFPGHPAHCYGTAFVAVIGILAAVRARLVTGLGDRVTVSMRDGVLAHMSMNWWSERRLSFIAAKSSTGALDMGTRRLLLRLFECSDGRSVQIHTGAAGAFGRLIELVGLKDQISPADAAMETGALLTDHDIHVLRTELPGIFRSKTADEWQRLCWEHEVACLPVQPPGEVFDDPQVRHAGIMETIDDHELGPIEVVGPVIKLSASPGAIQGPTPLADADGPRIREQGWRAAGLGSTAEPRDLDHPLDGVKVIEFANWFAAPYGNRLLSDLGADVVKVEPREGDPIRPIPDPCEGANRGKRSLAINLKAPAAASVLRGLVAGADVVQHNLRPGAGERLGIDYESLRAVNPDLIYAYAPGYGSTGPKAMLQSFAPLLSGFVGLMHMSAGPGNEPHTCFGNEDYYNGLLSATGILLALIHRERSGIGQHVETPQLLSSVLITSEWFRRGGVPESALPTLDREQMGRGPLYRLYQCLTGWICLACTTDDSARALVAEVLADDGEARELTSLGACTAMGDDLAGRLTYSFFGRTAEEWVARLRKHGVPCEVVLEDSWYERFLLDDERVADGSVNEINHPLHGRVRVIGQLFHLEQHPGVCRGRSPLLGEHTAELLAEAGLDDAAIARLVEEGVVDSTG